MRNILISSALLSAAAIATPAAAQWGYPQAHGYNQYDQGAVQGIRNQVRQIHQQVERMYQRRLLSNGERQSLHERADNIERRAFDYSRNGMSQREYFDLQNRVRTLRDRLQRERFEGREQRRDDRGRGRGRDRWDD